MFEKDKTIKIEIGINSDLRYILQRVIETDRSGDTTEQVAKIIKAFNVDK